MTAANVSLLNSVVLIAFGLWGYFDDGPESHPPTALIPVVVGGILLAMNPGVRKNNKVIAHIAVLLTLLILLGLLVPLVIELGHGNTLAIVRVAVMIVISVLAMVAFIRSFIAVRRARQADAAASDAE